MTSNLIRSSELTSKELGELHREYDGPIPPSAVDRKIGERSAPQSREQQLRDLRASHMEQATEYLECRDVAKARGNDATADLYNTKAMTYLGFADACDKELDALTAEHRQAAA